MPSHINLTTKLAVRNLTRHRSRSAIMLVALALFLGLCIGLEGIASGFYGSMTEVAVGQTLGEIQVHAVGHLPARDPEAVLDAGDDLAADVAEIEGVRVAAGRVRIAAMAGHGSRARGVDLIGASAAELEFGNIPTRVVEGRFLQPNEGGGAVIGRSLAKTLGLELGDALLIRGPAGEQRFELVGLFASGNRQTDAKLVYAAIDDVRPLADVRAGAITELAIRVERSADEDAIATKIRATCESVQPATPGCDVEVWSELQPALAASMTTDHNFLRAIFAVLVLVSGIMVLNLQLMSVLERTRELGLMLAIGATPRRLFSMLVVEATALGTIGVLGGLALGLAIVLGVSGGIDVAALAGGETELAGFAFAPKVYPELSPWVALAMAAGALTVTVLAAIIPAIPLFHMNPLAALQGRARSQAS